MSKVDQRTLLKILVKPGGGLGANSGALTASLLNKDGNK